jgi:type IX secretion system PorP/SprF family membrane protein
MRWIKQRSIWYILLVFMTFQGQGQDIHFSQFYNSPSTLNPSLTGFTNARLRAFVNHRNQWASVTLPFQTYAATIDAQLLKRKQKGDMLGFGFSAFSDKAGDSQFGTQSVSVSMSYVKALGEYSARNLIGFGISVSAVQRSLDYQSLFFDSQYNGVSFDPNLSTGEQFAIDNYQYYDIGAGANWFTNINYDITLNTGLAVWHINRPGQSLMNDEKVRLAIRSVLHMESTIKFEAPYELLPALLVQYQGTYFELVIGSRFKVINASRRSSYKAFYTGLFYRNQDAIIVYTGYQVQTLTFGLSYDFNISTLSPASRYLGGIELTLNWQLPANRPPKQKDLPCPIF